MDISVFNNKILIINNSIKKDLLKLISSELLNIKLITLSELKKKYFFDYDKKTIHYVSKKYNVIPDIAKIYINNLYYIDDINDDKITFLKELKKDLDDNDLLIYSPLFKDYLNNKDVVLFNLKYYDSFYDRVFNNIKNLERYNIEKEPSIKEIYKCNDKNEEISLIASKICELIKKDVDINDIKLANVSKEYVYTIKTIFKEFNIPVNLPSDNNIFSTKVVKTFIDNYSSDINNTIETVKESINNDKDSEILKQIINIVNNYSFIDDYMEVKEEIINDIKNTPLKGIKLNNAVEITSLDSELLGDHFVFLMGFNEGVIPAYVKDEDYLSDKIKEQLNIDNSVMKNKKTLNSLLDSIKMINHLIVTYPEYNNGQKLYVSSSYDSSLFTENYPSISLNHSDLYNKLKLVSLKDENKKYNTTSELLVKLNNHYKDMPYLDYNNKFKGLNKTDLYNYMHNSLMLSYSSLNTYNECAFKYYMDYILRINKFEDSFEINVGNIFHKVLSKCFNDVFDFDKEWEDAVSSITYEFTPSDKYYLSKLKDELVLIIETINNQLNYTQLTNIMCEKEIIINVNEELHITFKGFIDKLMYKEVDGIRIVAIVDYKTGNPYTNINNVVYGLDMQLPIYMYLIKNSNILTNVRIGGLYLQKILSNTKDIEEKKDSLKLQGYSNSDTEVLKYVDSSYMDSKVIKSLKMGNNGFYAYSKVISDENIDYLCNIVKNKIDETYKNILEGNFDINPKVINNINKGCVYCRYRDICYVRNEDFVNLKAVNDIFKGEDND